MSDYVHQGRVASVKLNKTKADGRKSRKFWTAEEDAVLLENLNELSYADIASKLPGRTKNMVRERARTLKIIK